MEYINQLTVYNKSYVKMAKKEENGKEEKRRKRKAPITHENAEVYVINYRVFVHYVYVEHIVCGFCFGSITLYLCSIILYL